MEIIINFDDDDIQQAQDLVKKYKEDDKILRRIKRNVQREWASNYKEHFSKEHVWYKLVDCLLTTQQNSSEGSPVNRFLNLEDFPLSYAAITKEKDIASFVHTTLKRSGGIRFTNKIPDQIDQNVKLFQDHVKWNVIEKALMSLANSHPNQFKEREIAAELGGVIPGFGPKQSRNFLQGLGLTQYEIPIDSRMMKWFKSIAKDKNRGLLNNSALGHSEYYNAVMDLILILCDKANILPCILDASVFRSLEKSPAKLG